MNLMDISLWCVSLLGIGLTVAAAVAVVVALISSIVQALRRNRSRAVPSAAWSGRRQRWHFSGPVEPAWRADRLRRLRHRSW